MIILIVPGGTKVKRGYKWICEVKDENKLSWQRGKYNWWLAEFEIAKDAKVRRFKDKNTATKVRLLRCWKITPSGFEPDPDVYELHHCGLPGTNATPIKYSTNTWTTVSQLSRRPCGSGIHYYTQKQLEWPGWVVSPAGKWTQGMVQNEAREVIK